MAVMLITSMAAPGPELEDYLSLTDGALRRRIEAERGLYIAESATVIARALAVGHQPRSVLTTERWLSELERLLVGHPCVPVYLVEPALLEAVTGYPVHRGALAAMQRPELLSVPEVLAGEGRARIAILEDLVDHTNVGAVFRSAAALGVHAVLATPNCADPLYRRSIKVSMGTVFQIPWTRIDPWPGGIEMLREAGYLVAGMSLGADAITLDELVGKDSDRLALVFGTEGHGLRPATDQRLDVRVTIPMQGGVDSLNVAAASAVAFYATR